MLSSILLKFCRLLVFVWIVTSLSTVAFAQGGGEVRKRNDLMRLLFLADKQIEDLNKKLSETRKFAEAISVVAMNSARSCLESNRRLRIGQAISMALSGVPNVSNTKNKVSFGLALGHFSNETALAVGMYYRVSETFLIKNAAATNLEFEEFGYTVGVGFIF